MVKKKLNDYQFDRLIGRLVFSPTKYGYDKGFWTSRLIVDMIHKMFKVRYSDRRVRELLKELGFSLKRPRMVSKLSDPDDQKEFIEKAVPEKIKEVKSIAKENKRRFKILCSDEAGFRRDGTLHNGWFLRGLTPEIEESNGRFESIRLYGAVDPYKGDITLKRIYGRMNRESYVSYLSYLSKKFSKNELLIIDDNAPFHSKASTINDILKSQGIFNIHILRFPKYSPKMNPCEKLWKWLRETVTHCRYYSDLIDLMDSIWRFYRRSYNDRESAKVRFKTEIPLFEDV